jgi:hypothetical protein
MKQTKRRVHTAVGLLSGLIAVSAQAQDATKPEVILIVDSSHNMNLRVDGTEPVCSLSNRPVADGAAGFPVSPQAIDYRADTAFSVLQQALVGELRTFDNAPTPWCITHIPDYRTAWHVMGADEAHPHHRSMCCAQASGALCARWAPCGEDHGRAPDVRNALTLADGTVNAWLAGGTLNRYADEVRFALMTSDSRIGSDIDHDGLYSYGDEVLRGPDGRLVNLGIRRSGSVNGALVRGGIGQLVGDNPDFGAGVDENPDSVRRHNELVAFQLRRTVPVGGAPLSAMLHDTLKYVTEQEAADPQFQCRRRVAVLVTRGREMAAYGGEACPCNAGAQCVAGRCEYPIGFPYESAEVYAGRLRDRGIPVHVVALDSEGGVGDLRARSIAEQGTPNVGAHRADDVVSLRQALNAVTRSVLTGRQSRTQPLVIASTPADYCPDNQFPCARPADAVVQWRINSFSSVTERGVYGRIHATEMTCGAQGQDNGRPTAPRPTRTPKQYEDVLASQQTPRRVVSTNPLAGNGVFAVSGADVSMFNDFGGLDGAFNVAEVQALTGEGADAQQNGAEGINVLPDHEPDGQLAIGLKINGYFGDAGLPADRAQAKRQLGGILRGDLVALQAPALGLSVPSYIAYERDQQQRRSLVAAGARDGLIHIFRATDGREVLNFVPRLAWDRMKDAETPVDGPLDVADVVPCRSVGENGPADCPSAPEDWAFQAWMVGGGGEVGANVFGVNLTRIGALAADPDRLLDPVADIGGDGIWDLESADIVNANMPPPRLGLSVSRPVLTHVRVRDRIRAAVIVGCGDDPFEGTATLPMSDGVGRCILVLDGTTGAVIRKFDFRDDLLMTFPVTGSPVAYPAGGIAPATTAYIGDRQGRLWRVDLRDPDPAQWDMEVAWPPLDGNQVDADAAGGYELGREVVDRPSLSLRPDGGLVVLFGTGERAVVNGTARSFMVSFTDRTLIDADGDISNQVTRNWVMELGAEERLTGPATVRNSTAFFTTRQTLDDGGCAEARGRLYGVHAHFQYVDADGQPATFQASGGRRLDVLPALTQFGADGEPLGQKALSVILPPGRVAYGLAIARTPSCAEGEVATNDLILNLSDESGGGQAGIQGAAAARASKLEVVQNEVVQETQLEGKVFARGQGIEFDLCLDCKPDGTAAEGLQGQGQGAFPSEVLYWGSTFLN